MNPVTCEAITERVNTCTVPCLPCQPLLPPPGLRLGRRPDSIFLCSSEKRRCAIKLVKPELWAGDNSAPHPTLNTGVRVTVIAEATGEIAAHLSQGMLGPNLGCDHVKKHLAVAWNLFGDCKCAKQFLCCMPAQPDTDFSLKVMLYAGRAGSVREALSAC